MTSSVTDRALSNREAAEFLGVSPKTLSNWRALGRGPAFVRYGDALTSRIAYPLPDLIAFRDAARVETYGGSLLGAKAKTGGE